MGRPKLLLPLGTQTVLERVVAAVRAGGIAEVLVVVGPADSGLTQAAEATGAHVLQLERDTGEMRETCLAGLGWLENRFHPSPEDGWLLLPADHPTIRADVIEAIVAAAGRHPEHSIFVPEHEGKRGHPVWLRWPHAAEVGALRAGVGLNALVRRHAAATMRLPWPSPEILFDLDTPEDYRRLCDSVGHED